MEILTLLIPHLTSNLRNRGPVILTAGLGNTTIATNHLVVAADNGFSYVAGRRGYGSSRTPR